MNRRALYTVFADTNPNAWNVEDCPHVKVMARGDRMQNQTTRLVGVTKAGNERLLDFFAQYESQGAIRLNVLRNPILESWETD